MSTPERKRGAERLKTREEKAGAGGQGERARERFFGGRESQRKVAQAGESRGERPPALG